MNIISKIKKIILDYCTNRVNIQERRAKLNEFLSAESIKAYMKLFRAAREKIPKGGPDPIFGSKHSDKMKQKLFQSLKSYRK